MAATTTTRWLLAATVSVAASGCAPSLHGQLDDVEAKIREENIRLDALHQAVGASEMRAAEAQRAAEYQECRATVASVRAEMTLQVARCGEVRAQHAACGAGNEAHTARASVAGCLLGIGVAMLTVGAGTPVAMLGCGGGMLYGHTTTNDCPNVACSIDPAVALPTALATHHLERLPACGGTLRITLGQLGQVADVQAGGPAALAGIGPGDVIIAVAGVRTESTEDLVRALGDHAPGEVVTIACLRGAQGFQVAVRLAEQK